MKNYFDVEKTNLMTEETISNKQILYNKLKTFFYKKLKNIIFLNFSVHLPMKANWY